MKTALAVILLLSAMCFAADDIEDHCGPHPALMRDSAGQVIWLSPSELDTRVVKKVPIEKPAVSGLEYAGVVSAKVMINTTGDVICIWNAAGSPIVLRNAILAAREWKFKPMMSKGAAAEYVGTLKIPVSTK
jgi:hypothetical protein